MMRIVILTGAGISAESGLGTFRDKDGLWTRYDLNDVATPQGFARNPRLVTEFYNARRANCAQAEPNAAHYALARLETALPGQVLIVTQNVDDLHQRAGARAVIQMHGALMSALCAACGHRWPAPPVMTETDPCPACAAPRTRPDVVWFGEVPYHMDTIADAVARAEIFAAIGTSGQVWPAAGFAAEARRAGAHCVELNLEPSEVSRAFHAHHYGPATQVVPAWVDTLLPT
ncbi:MAG: NAD-dependent deacylase [Rhodobacter sp.]|uniref:NAD-dependent deacylase n=1 Tax=Pararhodobacter sp. TaxID=2127056 RepID=UPI001DB83E53|nr:NAD-dependent deacylase [Pararhodobacter sp.]MCB1345001.1 NAD-dependent deacylase [Paracoccaceae bacterium]MCC0072096.1 NAD-dependent deacylase [Rhodobacter sp.]HPD92972.1 NAD-dependent deacylase [Pararhodobacter sp.]